MATKQEEIQYLRDIQTVLIQIKNAEKQQQDIQKRVDELNERKVAENHPSYTPPHHEDAEKAKKTTATKTRWIPNFLLLLFLASASLFTETNIGAVCMFLFFPIACTLPLGAFLLGVLMELAKGVGFKRLLGGIWKWNY